MISFALLAAVVLAGTAGDVSAARAMKTVGQLGNFRPATLLAFARRAAGNFFLWFGIFWKAVAFFSFLALLSRDQLSWVVPATAISFVLETLAAKYLLKETITNARWAGALCICVGVGLLSL